MQKSIDNETRMTAVRHARYIAEDIIKTQVAIKTQQALNRTDVVAFVNNIRNVNDGLKIPVPGTDCGNGAPCLLVVLSSSPTTIPPTGDVDVVIKIGISPAQSEKMKFKLEPLKVTLKIPKDIKSNQSLGSYSCSASAPVFKGLKKDGQKIVANCAVVPSADFVTIKAQQAGVLNVLCSVAQGKWMKLIESNLAPKCVDFSEVPKIPTSTEICESPSQYPKAYRLDPNFNLLSKTCVNRGNPYDFVPEAN
jgi:hypothetical protein